MENNKKIELSTSQIIIIILCSGIISIILFFSGFFIINSIMKNDTEVARVNENTTLEKQKVDKLKDIADIIPTPTTPPTPTTAIANSLNITTIDLQEEQEKLPEYYEDILEKSERFTISKVEEESDGYKLYIHVLENEPRKTSKEEWDYVINGGTIKFRGRNWKLADSFIDNNYILLGSENSNLVISIENNNGEYIFLDEYGKEVSDYKTDEITTIKVDKDIVAGDRFSRFLYNKNTEKVVVTNYDFQEYTNTEEENKELFELLEKIDATTTYGECLVYFLNDKIVAFQTFTASSP